jgi:hypothetical protein
LPRLLTGRNLYYYRQNGAMTLAHLLLNRLSHGDAKAFGRMLTACMKGAKIRVKRLVFDNGLRLGASGRLECLDYCPNATVRKGRMVPVCLSDYLSSASELP